MADPVPLRPGLVPNDDRSRVMLDHVANQISRFTEVMGEAPTSICFVLHGRGSAGDATSVGYEIEGLVGSTLALSGAMLTEKALEACKPVAS